MNNLLQIYVGGAAPDAIKVVADLELFVEQCPITAQDRSGRRHIPIIVTYLCDALSKLIFTGALALVGRVT
jgi:hypothetical protein